MGSTAVGLNRGIRGGQHVSCMNLTRSKAMERKNSALGFSLIELLAVVAIMGIIAGVAIPSFLGQRARARSIGDAQATSQVLRMALETYKADNGIYGVDKTNYTWTAGVGANTDAAALLPSFSASSSRMNYLVATTNNGLKYTITVNDPTIAGAPEIFQTDETGATLFLAKY
jgi:prepilin-type N-terminal cleavage/methylation domain-containing protein